MTAIHEIHGDMRYNATGVHAAGTTDAAAMQLARGGMPAGCVSIPTRYLHTPSEMVDLRDVDGVVSLLGDTLSKPIEI